MAKPIYLSREVLDGVIEEFRRSITHANLFDGTIDFKKKFNYNCEENEKVYLVFRPMAYIKMLALLRHYDSEVAWHGTVEREDDKTFVITDVVVYPQTVAAATVNTDQEEYQNWLMQLDDDYFNAMRMQGHSHVNMGTMPSPTDDEHQRAILSQLKGDDYYIFMIFNKDLKHTIRIYDYANNVMYEDKDVTLAVGDDEFDVASFLTEADELVKRKAACSVVYDSRWGGYRGYGGGYGGYGDNGQGRDKNASKAPSKPAKKDSAKKAEPKAKPAPKNGALAKGKRGRPPKNASKAADAQMSMTGCPGFYGIDDVSIDWDEEIFGDRRFDT